MPAEFRRFADSLRRNAEFEVNKQPNLKRSLDYYKDRAKVAVDHDPAEAEWWNYLASIVEAMHSASIELEKGCSDFADYFDGKQNGAVY